MREEQVKRLNEIHNIAAEQRLERASQRADVSGRRPAALVRIAAVAEHPVAALMADLAAAKQRVEKAEHKADISDKRADAAEQRADVSDKRADAAEQRADVSDKRADAAEQRADVTDNRAAAAKQRVEGAGEPVAALTAQIAAADQTVATQVHVQAQVRGLRIAFPAEKNLRARASSSSVRNAILIDATGMHMTLLNALSLEPVHRCFK